MNQRGVGEKALRALKLQFEENKAEWDKNKCARRKNTFE